MYFQQFFLTCLAHASYMIGSEGAAAVIDPQRDVDIYLEEAAKNGLRIAYVIETHLHADFVSGHQELAARTGARVCLGANSGAKFPHTGLREGDEIAFGKCVLRVMQTPGHTEESICLLLTDLERGPQPIAVLTGDTLFVGDVGRPDLSPSLTPAQLAARLYDSLHGKLLALPDEVQVYPAHGAGSLCGKNMGPERCSTIGKERAANYALQPMSREEFVELLTSELPERPSYFLQDAEINRTGASALSALPPLPVLRPQDLRERQARGEIILDTRPPEPFGAAHIPGAINISLAGQYASWAGTVVGLEARIVLVSDGDRLEESRLRLARVGMENVTGYLDGGFASWQSAGFPTAQIRQVSVVDLRRKLGEAPEEIQVIDVRGVAEWRAGHLAEAVWKPLGALASSLDGLDRERPVAVHCQSGYRSAIGSSILKRAGFANVWNVTGGFEAWKSRFLPFVSQDGR